MTGLTMPARVRRDSDVHGAVARSGAIMLGASVVGALANFAMVTIVGRGAGAAETGLFFTAIGLTTVVANSVRMGSDTGLVRMLSRLVAQGRTADLRPTLQVAIVPVLVVATALGAIALAFAGPLSRAIAAPADVGSTTTIIRVAAVAIPLLAVSTALMAAARALGRVGSFAAVQNVLLPVGRLAGVAAALAASSSLATLVFGWAIIAPLAVCVAAVIAMVALGRVVAARAPATPATPRRALAREFWGFALPRGAAATVETALDWADVVLVAALAGPTQAGIYAVATRCVKLILILDYATRVSLSTRISAALATDRHHVVSGIYGLGARAMIAIGWPVCIILAVFSGAVMTVFGAEFGDGAVALTVLALGMMLVVAAGSVQSILLLGGRSSYQLANKSVALAVCVAGNLLVTGATEAAGAAVVWCLAMVVDAGLAAWQVRRTMAVRLPLAAVLRTAAAALVSTVPIALAFREVVGPGLTVAVAAFIASAALFLLILTRTGELATFTTAIHEISEEYA